MKLTLPKQNLDFLWKLAIAFGSGILMGLTPAPFNVWWLAWLALAPLWVLVLQEYKSREEEEQGSRGAGLRRERSAEQAQRIGYALAWGVGYHGLALFWITGIHPMTWMGVNWWVSLAIAAFAWSFITLWGAAIAVVWTWLMLQLHHFWYQPLRVKTPPPLLPSPSATLPLSRSSPPLSPRRTPFQTWLRILLGTALWCLLENLWSQGALYWSSLSYTQSPYNLAILHLGQLSGPLIVTAAIVGINGLLAETWMQGRDQGFSSKDAPRTGIRGWGLGSVLSVVCSCATRTNKQPFQQGSNHALEVSWGLPIGCCLVLHLVGGWLAWQPLADVPEMAIQVGIVQGNIPNTIKLYEDGWQRSLNHYTNGYLTLVEQGIEVVLTPETALPVQWLGDERKRILFYQKLVEKGVPVWLGAFGGNGRRLTNSLFTVAGNGETVSEYRKVKLVPLGEYIPFEQWLGGLINRLSPLDAQLRAGKPDQIFETPFGRAIAAICYESAFPEIFRYQAAAGGEFILTASNNAHYSATMPAQHHAQDVMRAIETDRWAARATNTGYSAIVDPHGKTLWISGINTYETHADTIYRRQTQTLYVRWGAWLTPSLGAIAILAYGGSMVISTRRLR